MTPAAGPSLTYLLAHPDTLGVSVPHPAALLLLLLVPLLVRWARVDLARRRLVMGLRIAAFTLLVAALAGVRLSSRLPSDRLSLVAAVDVSQSIDADGRKWEARYLDEVARALAPGDELAVVAFAKDAAVVRAPAPASAAPVPAAPVPVAPVPVAPVPADLGQVAMSATATDIGRALDTAMALFPADAERRLLLLSDGNETRGSALSKVARAQHAGVRIYTAVPPHAGGPDVAVEKLAVAPLVAEGSVFPVRVILRNQAKVRPAALSLFVDGERIGEEQLTLQPGLNAVEIPYRLNGPGSHVLRVQVSAAGDVVPGNDYRQAAVMVGGKSRVLLVTPRSRSVVASILARKDIGVTTVAPADFPAELDALLRYHCVVFEDVTASTLAPRKLAVLERYVKDFGGGFIVAAGEHTYSDERFKNTAVERLLPVTIEPHRPPRTEREPLALFILIDRSNSMGYHIRNRLERSETESKMAYARRAALAVVQQLKDTDMVGLIAFDSLPLVVSELRPLKENRVLLEDDIPRLQPSGGTDFYDALDAARRQLIESRVNTTHIMLLTDGDTNRGAADHYPLIDALVKAGISVTTIRIGDDTVNLTLLNDISSRTGGQFYHVENVETLPELLLKDTTQAVAQAPRRAESYVPRLAAASQVLRGIKPNDLPVLSGYAYARPKTGADVLLYVLAHDRKDPVLAAWQYGLGRVVAFTASPDDDAEAWVGWEGFGKFWSQLVHWAVREQTPWDYALEVHRVDGQATLTLQAFGDIDEGVLLARLLVNPDKPSDVPLVPRGPREFVGRLPAVPAGRYPLTITTRLGNRDVRQRTEMLTVPGVDEEPQEEFEVDHPNRPLLQALAQQTGGAVDAPVRSIVGRTPGTRRVDHPLDWVLIPAAMILFLADVAVRRLGVPGPRQ